jgi:integral membrane sensor domain MASE1
VFAIITLSSLILLTFGRQVVIAPRVRRQRFTELGILMIGLLAVSISAFRSSATAPATSTALLFAPLPLLLWAAVRLGLGALTLPFLSLPSSRW